MEGPENHEKLAYTNHDSLHKSEIDLPLYQENKAFEKSKIDFCIALHFNATKIQVFFKYDYRPRQLKKT